MGWRDSLNAQVVAETRIEGGRRLLTLSSHIKAHSFVDADIEVREHAG